MLRPHFFLALFGAALVTIATTQLLRVSRCEVLPAHQVVRISPDAKAVDVEFRLHSSYDLVLGSVTTSCSCVAVNDQFPIVINRRQPRTINLTIDTSAIRNHSSIRFLFHVIPLASKFPVATVELDYAGPVEAPSSVP